MGLFDSSPFEQLTGRKSPLEVRFPSFSKKAGEFGKTAGMLPMLGGVRTIAPGIASMPSKVTWLSKIPLPSLTTTAKVAGTGAIVYTGYKGVQGIGKTFDDFFGTGTPPENGKTKKETKVEGGDGIFPPTPAGTPVTYIYQAAAEPQGFYGGLGAGAEGVGSGVGSGLGMAIPVLAVGGLAYILLKEKKGKK